MDGVQWLLLEGRFLVRGRAEPLDGIGPPRDGTPPASHLSERRCERRPGWGRGKESRDSVPEHLRSRGTTAASQSPGPRCRDRGGAQGIFWPPPRFPPRRPRRPGGLNARLLGPPAEPRFRPRLPEPRRQVPGGGPLALGGKSGTRRLWEPRRCVANHAWGDISPCALPAVPGCPKPPSTAGCG